jgi:hypothetical protein
MKNHRPSQLNIRWKSKGFELPDGKGQNFNLKTGKLGVSEQVRRRTTAYNHVNIVYDIILSIELWAGYRKLKYTKQRQKQLQSTDLKYGL